MDGNEAKKQLETVEREISRGRAAKASVETKIVAERRALEIATARRSGWVGKLAEPGADTARYHKEIDKEEAQIKASTRLLEALERQLQCAAEEIAVFERDRQRIQQEIAAVEREQEFSAWAAQGKQQVQDARQKLDDARASYGALSSLFEAGKQKFGPRAMFVLEQPLAELTREQSNPGVVGWRPVVGNMLNAVSILPMQR